MGLLNKLLGSNTNLRGPNLEKSLWLKLDFSGTKLRFKDPQHTGMYPVEIFAEDMNIYEKNKYERQNDGHLIKNFYLKGWDLIGYMNKEKGGVDALGRLFYFDEIIASKNDCFDKKTFERKVIEFCHRSWHKQNDEAYIGSERQNGFDYPTNAGKLNYKTINSIRWCYFQAKRIGKPPTVEFATSISSNHLLIMTFTLGAYNEVDFHSPSTNLEQASHKLVEDFMSYFYIELSPEAKAQQAAADDRI